MTFDWTLLDPLPEAVARFAACRDSDPALFFPKSGPASDEVLAICGACPAKAACADYAITAPILLRGIWGGTTTSDRTRLRAAAAEVPA